LKESFEKHHPGSYNECSNGWYFTHFSEKNGSTYFCWKYLEQKLPYLRTWRELGIKLMMLSKN
jgi:hypothetical protein